MNSAVTVILIDNRPGESLYVKVLKGRIKIEDADLLRTIHVGEEYRREWGRPASDTDQAEKVYVHAMPLSPVMHTPPAGPVDVCALLRSQRDQIIKTRDNCRKKPGPTGCEMFNTQIEQIDNEVRMRCKLP
jgi:hypothetical protein